MYGLAPDSNIGGEVYERNLLLRLPARGIVPVLGVPRDIELVDPPPTWRVDHLGGSPHWATAPARFTPYVLSLLRTRRVQLLRGHSVRYCGPSLLLGRRLARSGVPIVLHHHHLSERWGWLEARILTRADAVVAVSEHARHRLLAAGVSADRVHVVVQGVARPPGTDGWPAAWPAEGLRLLTLGRLEPRKRPQLAIDAVAALRRRGIAASLVVAGEGPMSLALAERAHALGVADAVVLVGRVADHDKWRLYDSAQALIFTSALEGFGVVVAEAQSRGVPVVATAETASIEAFEPDRTGYLAAPTGDALAAALARLADEPARLEMSAAAREFAERFDWDRCADEVAAIYRQLVVGAADADLRT